MQYLRDPAEIMRRSFAILEREAGLDGLPEGEAKVAARLIHACGMPDIAADLAFAGDPAQTARKALDGGAPVLADGWMTAAGIIRRSLPASNQVLCTLDEVDAEAAAARTTTRSAAAVDLWLPRLGGAVVAIGNAPTALFRLLELLDGDAPRPSVIFAFPVGFVGAVESKEALIADPHGVPYVALRGRRGGSALAAASVNAVAVL